LTPNYGVAPHEGIYNEPLQNAHILPCMLRFFICYTLTPTASRALSLDVICIFEMACIINN
ncbi:MAG: hypothetical protein OET81_10290, partial [Desulfobacteraceae bacterium]|nr:hypothetical protein [Desulfobacteraceae bacterium]